MSFIYLNYMINLLLFFNIKKNKNLASFEHNTKLISLHIILNSIFYCIDVYINLNIYKKKKNC